MKLAFPVLLATVWALSPAFSLQRTLGQASRPAKPHILVMMADDMGLGDTSAYKGIRLVEKANPIGKTLVTPNIEKFSEQAILFTDAHAPASMCSSTRYSLLTGRFAHRPYLKQQGWLPHGPNRPMIQKDMPTLPGMLRKNGYHTKGVGKYHVGIDYDDGDGQPAKNFYFHDVYFTKPLIDGPTHHGFDEYYGVTGNTEDSLDTAPRIMIVNDGHGFKERSKMKLAGITRRENKILAAPDWDLRQLGPLYLQEMEKYLDRRATDADSPFFLYFVPNANHNQRNVDGVFAVPEEVAGVKIKGQSRYTDGAKAGDREDMVLENDVIFGKILDKLKQTEDPRWPGHKMIENTLIIFTSDNGPNLSAVKNEILVQESGGLRGKKAKIWEGGHRVPFLLYWQGPFENGMNRNLFSLTDLYATLASIVGHELQIEEARDSHDALPYWTGEAKGEDLRPRVFFCNLGSPYLNDTLAIREGSKKLLVDGGLAMPAMKGGSRGGVNLAMFYDLDHNLYEEGDFLDSVPSNEAREMGERLLAIHNRGYARDLGLKKSEALILDDGWHNLRNDLDGAIGFEFRMKEDRAVTHLGMWDDQIKDSGVRPARNLPTEANRDQPTLAGAKKRGISAPHLIQLHELDDNGPAKLIAKAETSPQRQGKLEGEFRYIQVGDKVTLTKGQRYLLTMSTAAGDGDHFHDPASFDGLSPLVCPSIEVVRSVLLRGDAPNASEAIPAFSDLSEAYSKHRLPVGPTLKFQ
jgi:arylsulfatase A-like enzyme